ncbi:lytic transglycosylase, partial [Streptomyces sp. E11-3]
SPTPTQPADRVDRIVDADTGTLTATEGTEFTARPAVQARDADGKGVAKVQVKFAIVGDTDTTFAEGATSATVTTDADGLATAPVLTAGAQTGEFTVRATVVGRTLSGLDYAATVTARQADTLTRTGEEELTCAPGGEFADAVEVQATLDGKAAAGVTVTATMIKSLEEPDENDAGPYFKDADDNPVRTLRGLKTDENGVLTLPQMFADETEGTYLLRLNAIGGGTLTIELTVG